MFTRLALFGALSILLPSDGVRAQPCGPFNVVTAVTGPGCAPFGGGVPTLSAGLGLSPAGVCRIPFTLQAPPSLFASPRPVLLVLGLSNPFLPLVGFGLPGCTLQAAPDAVGAMAIAGSNNLVYVSVLQVPHDPALVGTTVFGQGAMLPVGPAGFSLSNGLVVGL